MTQQKIKSFSFEQWQEVGRIIDRWFDYQKESLDVDACRSVVRRMYRAMTEDEPAVLIFSSPIMACRAWEVLKKTDLKKHLNSQLYSQLGSQLNSQLYSQLNSQLYSQLYSQLNSQLDSQLYSQLYSQLDSQLDSQLNSQLNSQLDSLQWYVCLYWSSWAAWYQCGEQGGVKFDQDKLHLFIDWAKCIQFIVACKGIAFISQKPTEIHWDANRQFLHNESGPSVLYSDGWSVWTVDGIPVDEQIVMNPDTQTLKQIDSDGNADRKAIRIRRFGWPRYLKETGAELRHESKNYVTGCPEALYRTKDGIQRLVVVCPTGRTFSLGIPPEIDTCEAAQRWLGPPNINVISAS